MRGFTFQVRGCTPESSSGKSHLTTFISIRYKPKLSKNILNEVFNWYRVRKFVNSKYQPVIAICACADFSNFKHKCVKVFLLNLCSECQNSVKKSTSRFKDINHIQTEFLRNGKFSLSRMHKLHRGKWVKMGTFFFYDFIYTKHESR